MAYTEAGNGGVFATGTSSPLTMTVGAPVLGNVLVVYAGGSSTGTAPAVSSISYAGVTTWHTLVASGGANDSEIWWGVVTATGTSTMTINFTGSLIVNLLAFADTYHSSTGGTWRADSSTATGTFTASAGGNFPAVTPSVSLPLYLGCQEITSVGLPAGSTSGFIYNNTSGTTDALQWVYNLAPGSGSASPNWTDSIAGNGSLVAGFLTTAAVASTFVHPVIVSQAVNRASRY